MDFAALLIQRGVLESLGVILALLILVCNRKDEL